jgi:hypothetical protein
MIRLKNRLNCDMGCASKESAEFDGPLWEDPAHNAFVMRLTGGPLKRVTTHR